MVQSNYEICFNPTITKISNVLYIILYSRKQSLIKNPHHHSHNSKLKLQDIKLLKFSMIIYQVQQLKKN